LKLEVVVEVYVEMILLQKLLLMLMMMIIISPLTFNFCTEFTHNYTLSLLRYFAPETKRITSPRLLVVSRMDYSFDFETHIL